MQAHRSAFTFLVSLAAAATLVAGQEARAEGACGHPAMTHGAACTAVAGIDANTFLVQPPASTRWEVRGGHANGEHPAVLVARRQQRGVDANTFLVQPPVVVTWTVQEPVTLMAAAQR